MPCMEAPCGVPCLGPDSNTSSLTTAPSTRYQHLTSTSFTSFLHFTPCDILKTQILFLALLCLKSLHLTSFEIRFKIFWQSLYVSLCYTVSVCILGLTIHCHSPKFSGLFLVHFGISCFMGSSTASAFLYIIF